MGILRRLIGRKRAIRAFWTLIACLLLFAIHENYYSLSDPVVYSVLLASFFLLTCLTAYIYSAKHRYSTDGLVFIFSKEHGATVEMHLKRSSKDGPSELRTGLMRALDEMRDYAVRVGATKLSVHSPLLDSGFAALAGKRAAKRLAGNYHALPPRTFSRVVSILAHREIHKNDVPRPTLRETLGAKLTSHGFIVELPT